MNPNPWKQETSMLISFQPWTWVLVYQAGTRKPINCYRQETKPSRKTGARRTVALNEKAERTEEERCASDHSSSIHQTTRMSMSLKPNARSFDSFMETAMFNPNCLIDAGGVIGRAESRRERHWRESPQRIRHMPGKTGLSYS